MRRCVTVLAISTAAALWAAPSAGAITKVVVAGGPPPQASLAGSLRFPPELDLNGFYRQRITINVGDSVRWVMSKRVVHTVTFLRRGQRRPALEAPDPANPYTGFTDAAGAPFWFNGQPSISIPPQNAFPQGGSSTDGTKYMNSGLTAPAFRPYRIRFTKAGTFGYLCLVHPGMNGSVRVLPRGRDIPSAAEDRAARTREFASDVRRARELARFNPTGNNVVAGHDRATVAWFRFFPRERTVGVGQAVRFSISSRSEIHTVMFGPEAYRDAIERQLVMAQPQPGGPPRLQFNPMIFLPSDPALPPFTGLNHGNGFLNTGVLDTNPRSPAPSSANVTFTARGTYLFECTIHPGMEGTITVT